ncbi:peptidase S66 family protein [Intrasporangium oryzae NRRL B-24470]|uniref:Peptidase S66 family protein n=1 Tax=Intrasporangium oryzae NRRL B-24470 TaxID=1386089 RepID=W9G4R9_9MICO|nr:peptidase S66 family protein [Intrasporangium oryzae NRRL B-24470]
MRYPEPLRPGDRIGVTAPSAGVSETLFPRLRHAVAVLEGRGFEVEVGECIGTPTHVSAPKEQRAAELTRMLTDPAVRAVVPPWGGETGIDLLDLLDLEAIAAAEPRWVVGFSDTSTWLTPLTLLTGLATIHGQNLMDTPYTPPSGILHWLDVATAPSGTSLAQHSPGRHRTGGFDDFAAHPTVSEFTLDGTGTWTRIDPGHEGEAATVSGRLIGGCVETIGFTAGTRFGDVGAFARDYAPEGLLHYLDICEWSSFDICRALHGMRLAGWFDQATGILVSRTRAPDTAGFTQHDAVRDALGMLGVPIIADVECGHVPPHLPLVNGALTTVVHARDEHSVTQTLS